MSSFPCLVRSSTSGGETRFALGDPLVDSYLAFVAGRARANTLRAVAHDLKTFFGVVGKDPADVVAADVFDFLAHQRGDRTVVRISDGESGLSARTIARRLSSISGFYSYLVARGDTPVRANPVPRGLSTRRRGGRRQQVPLVRVPRTLPKVLSPAEVNALIAALRTDRDRAMVFAMVLGGLRRCEVLGLRLGDIGVPERSLFVAEGKGGHQRVIPISNTFFAAVGDYLRGERPRATDTDRVFLALKGPTRGQPLTADGIDTILRAARERAGLERATCHQLRHTCLTPSTRERHPGPTGHDGGPSDRQVVLEVCRPLPRLGRACIPVWSLVRAEGGRTSTPPARASSGHGGCALSSCWRSVRRSRPQLGGQANRGDDSRVAGTAAEVA